MTGTASNIVAVEVENALEGPVEFVEALDAAQRPGENGSASSAKPGNTEAAPVNCEMQKTTVAASKASDNEDYPEPETLTSEAPIFCDHVGPSGADGDVVSRKETNTSAAGLSSIYRMDSNMERYQRFSNLRRQSMILIIGFSTFQVPFATTSFLPLVPEMAESFGVSQELVTATNGIASIFMALSPLIFGPLTEVYGRKPLMIACSTLFSLASLAVALSPNIAAFCVFRCLTFLGGVSFFNIGSSILGDIYPPAERGKAMAWMLFGSQFGPGLGPIIGGIIVTYRSWRVLYWLQLAMAVSMVPIYVFFLPETAHSTTASKIREESGKRFVWVWFNPLRVVRLFAHPSLAMLAVMSTSLMWGMYLQLVPIRQIMDPRFNLTTPIQGSLFYLAPSAGYFTGTFLGGRITNSVVQKWIKKKGCRVPEDRVRSVQIPLGVILPIAMLIYGWCMEYGKGGYPIPIICLFLFGTCQTLSFSCINPCCIDSLPNEAANAIAGNYSIRYVSAAVSTTACLPMINAMGIGWCSVIAALYYWAAMACAFILIHKGENIRAWYNAKQKKKLQKTKEKVKSETHQDV